jgi:hypothetical protein
MTFPGRECTSREPEKRALWLADAMVQPKLTKLPSRDDPSSSIGRMAPKPVRIIVLSEPVIVLPFACSIPAAADGFSAQMNNLNDILINVDV